MNSWLPVKNCPCPSCGGKDTAVRKSKGVLRGEMTLCAERACKDCGTIFEPPAHPGWAIVAIGMGAGMCVMLLSDKVPTIYHALRPFSLGRILKESIYLLGLLWIGIQIVFVGWKGLRRREPRIVR